MEVNQFNSSNFFKFLLNLKESTTFRVPQTTHPPWRAHASFFFFCLCPQKPLKIYRKEDNTHNNHGETGFKIKARENTQKR